MSLRSKLLAAAGGAGATSKLYAEDVFSAYTYTGNASTQTITNGIDLSGKGGLVWIKKRVPGAGYNHTLWDTVRGATNFLITDTNFSQGTSATGLSAFNSTGFSLGLLGNVNDNAGDFISWTFRKAPKFFDVVTWTGDGVTTGRTITHSLGSVPAVILYKQTSGSGGPWTWAQYSGGTSYWLRLNETSASSFSLVTGGYIAPQNATTTSFDAFGNGGVNLNNSNGETYVAYLFAHDAGIDGLIQCGSFTTDASGFASVALGWEPQLVWLKRADSAGDWVQHDTARGSSQTKGAYLYANTSGAEVATNGMVPEASGFRVIGNTTAVSATYIYLAIRRPNKPPAAGTQVYNGIARTGTGAAAAVTGVGFAPDALLVRSRNGNVGSFACSATLIDKLRGTTPYLFTTTTSGEGSSTNTVTSFDTNGVTFGSDGSIATMNYDGSENYINHFFKRAPGFFDEVCDPSTGAAHSVAHSLAAAPELWIRKVRNDVNVWTVGCASLGASKYLQLESTMAAVTDATAWNNTLPTATVFTLGTLNQVNRSTNYNYVTYLFATLAGISKVFSYTGNGSSQTINCGFTTGARFILIKRTDSTGDWFVWDAVRGIVSANDPHLSLNTTAVEVTNDDSVDPDTTGFIVNQLAATNINVTSATYIGLAIA